MDGRPDSPSGPSLCPSCASMREVVSGKGSRFLLCKQSPTDPSFPKYPMQPVVRCPGYGPRGDRPDSPSEGATGEGRGTTGDG